MTTIFKKFVTLTKGSLGYIGSVLSSGGLFRGQADTPGIESPGSNYEAFAQDVPSGRTSPPGRNILDWKRSLTGHEYVFLELQDMERRFTEPDQLCNYCKQIIDSSYVRYSDENSTVRVWSCRHSRTYHRCCYAQLMKSAGYGTPPNLSSEVCPQCRIASEDKPRRKKRRRNRRADE